MFSVRNYFHLIDADWLTFTGNENSAEVEAGAPAENEELETTNEHNYVEIHPTQTEGTESVLEAKAEVDESKVSEPSSIRNESDFPAKRFWWNHNQGPKDSSPRPDQTSQGPDDDERIEQELMAKEQVEAMDPDEEEASEPSIPEQNMARKLAALAEITERYKAGETGADLTTLMRDGLQTFSIPEKRSASTTSSVSPSTPGGYGSLSSAFKYASTLQEKATSPIIPGVGKHDLGRSRTFDDDSDGTPSEYDKKTLSSWRQNVAMGGTISDPFDGNENIAMGGTDDSSDISAFPNTRLPQGSATASATTATNEQFDFDDENMENASDASNGNVEVPLESSVPAAQFLSEQEANSAFQIPGSNSPGTSRSFASTPTSASPLEFPRLSTSVLSQSSMLPSYQGSSHGNVDVPGVSQNNTSFAAPSFASPELGGPSPPLPRSPASTTPNLPTGLNISGISPLASPVSSSAFTSAKLSISGISQPNTPRLSSTRSSGSPNIPETWQPNQLRSSPISQLRGLDPSSRNAQLGTFSQATPGLDLPSDSEEYDAQSPSDASGSQTFSDQDANSAGSESSVQEITDSDGKTGRD